MRTGHPIALIAGLLFCTVVPAPAQQTPDSTLSTTPTEESQVYFPAKPGLVWTYAGRPVETARVVRIVEVELANGTSEMVWEGLAGRRTIQYRTAGQVWEVRNGQERLLLDLQAPEGSVWTIPPLEDADDLLDGTGFTVTDRSAAVRVPYGVLEDCVYLRMRPSPALADAGVTEAWFAPGLGLVQWTETTIVGPQTYELLSFGYANDGSADADSTVVSPGWPLPEPRPLPVDTLIAFEGMENAAVVDRDGIRYELAADQPTYTQGDVMVMAYRITLVERDSVRFAFGSTQQIEFLLVDSEGRKRWVWSEGLSFGEVLTALSLSRGESKTFYARMRVSDASLPRGEYALVGFLPVQGSGSQSQDATGMEVRVTVMIQDDPEPTGISGVVSGPYGRPVVDAHVTAVPIDAVEGTAKRDAWTQSDGSFHISDLNADEYTIHAEKEGYQSVRSRLSLGLGEYRLDLMLRPHADDGYANSHLTRHGDLVAELATDRVSYEVGDSVYVRYRLVNSGESSVHLFFPSGQRYDLAVDGSEGRVWTWSETRDYVQVTGEADLPPGDTYEFSEQFPVSSRWASNGDSYLMTGFLVVAPSGDTSLSHEATEAVVKFGVRDGSGSVDPVPLPPDRPSDGLETRIWAGLDQDSAYVRYVVTNTSHEAVKLMFRSGQQYEILLEDEAGVIWQWSRGRGFHDALWDQVLAPGDSVVVNEVMGVPVDLDRDGDTAYVLKAYLTVSPDEAGTPDAGSTQVRLDFTLRENEIVLRDPSPPEPAEPTVDRELSAADLDGDGRVGFPDFLMFARAYSLASQGAEFQPVMDLDGDGSIGFGDFLTFSSLYQR